MRSELWFLAALGFVNATELVNREPQATGGAASYSNWHPKTNHPEFLSLRIDIHAACNSNTDEGDYEAGAAPDCTMRDMAIRLSDGYVIASNYSKWWDPKLPIFLTDDDTKLYTVSKAPLQLYIDVVSGALRYCLVGPLPANSIPISFYKTGDNPQGIIGPSPAFLSWPSTQGVASNSLDYQPPWWLCSVGPTRNQYRVFISNSNFGLGGGNDDYSSDVSKDPRYCKRESLAAINANPWKKGQPAPY